MKPECLHDTQLRLFKPIFVSQLHPPSLSVHGATALELRGAIALGRVLPRLSWSHGSAAPTWKRPLLAARGSRHLEQQ